VTLHRITTVELDCLKRLATAMKQHLDEFGTIPSPGHPIWRVFWAWSHINRIIYHHHEHPTVSFGQCGDVPHMEGAFASDATPTCESFVYDGHLMGFAGIATHRCDHTETGVQHSTGGFAVGCGELIDVS
jgi:hypothetical protein